MLALDDAGYDIRAHVHDEVIVTEPLDGRSVEEMSEVMGQPIPWAPGLPLRADGYSCPFYIKD
jgi:DNA polymerase